MCLLLLQLRSKMKIAISLGTLYFHVLNLKWNREALEAELAGLGGIDDVEDMLDDEGFLRLLSQQEVSVPPTFVTLDNFLYDNWLSLLLIIFKYRCNWSQMCDGSPDLHRQQREEQDDCIYSFVHWSCCAPQKRLESASYSGYFARRRCFF